MNLEVNSNSYLNKNPYIFLSILLLIGFILRIYLSTLITYDGDFATWNWWAEGLSKVGFSKFYDNYWCDYMPGYLYVLRLLNDIQSELPWLSPHILYKLPANLSDLGISILIYLVLKPISSTRIAIISSVAYFFNPAALSNSTFWGQVDSVHAFPILLAIILGLRKKFFLAGLFAAVAFMIKPQTIVLFPIIGFTALEPFFHPGKRWKIKNFLPGIKVIITAIATLIIIALPFIWYQIDSFAYIFTGPFELVKERFDSAYEQYKYASLNTFNFWGVFAMWTSDETIYWGLQFKSWGTIIFGSFYALIFAFFFRYKIFNQNNKDEYTYLIFQAVTLILFSLFLFVTRAHERHLLPAIVFFALILYRSWIFPYLYAIVSGVYVCNMIYSYIELTTEYKGVSDSVQDFLVPTMFLLYFTAFVIVLLNFFRQTNKKEDIVNRT